MLCWHRPDSVAGTSRTLTRRSGSGPAPSTVMSPSKTVMARPPASRDSRTAGESARSVNTHGLARVPARMAHTRGSSPLSTAQPPGFVARVTIALTSASWSTVSIPCSPRWSAETLVTTETSLVATPMPLSSMPPARGLEDAQLHPWRGEHRPGPGGPGVVTPLGHLALHDDAVGGGPRRLQPRRHADVAQHPRGRGLAVGARDRGHRDGRHQHERSSRRGRSG